MHTWNNGIRETGDTTSPDIYRGIEPDISPCAITTDRMYLEGGAGERVLSNGDIGPTDSVDVSDPDQVTRFFVWHRDNGFVGLEFHHPDISSDLSSVSDFDVYTFSLPSAKIGPPETIYASYITDLNPRIEATITPQSCSFPPLPIH